MKEKLSKLESANIRTPNIDREKIALYVLCGFVIFQLTITWIIATSTPDGILNAGVCMMFFLFCAPFNMAIMVLSNIIMQKF